MTEEEKRQLAQLMLEMRQTKEKLEAFLSVYYHTNFPDVMIIEKNLSVLGTITVRDSLIVQNLLGLFGATPVGQQAAVTTPSGGGSASTDAIDITARVAIGQIKTALQNIGLIP